MKSPQKQIVCGLIVVVLIGITAYSQQRRRGRAAAAKPRSPSRFVGS